MEREENKMGTKRIFPLLMTMALPAMLSMFIQSMYNVVDSMFVARIGEEAITAVSLAFPIQNIILAVAVGTGVGINSVISRRLGEKNYDKANSAVTHGLIIGVIEAVIFIVLGLIFINPFFKMFTESKEVINLGVNYTYIVTMLSFGVIIHIIIEKVLQSTGNMIYPMIFQAVGAITNIILDPIFIFGLFGVPKMGVAGAAIATVAGQILAMTLSVITLIYKNHEVEIKKKGFKFEMKVVKEIFTVGAPSIMMISLGSILVMGLNAILISFSQVAVALFGIYFKLQSFVFMPVSGLTQGAMPILGYNYGAKNRDRFINTLKLGIIVSVIIMAAGNFIFLAFPEELLMIFNASEEMLSIGKTALCTISLSYIPAALGLLFATAFQAIGKGNLSLLITLLRQIIIILPMAFILSKFIGLTGVWITFPIAEIVAAIFAGLMFIRVCKRDSVLNNDGLTLIKDEVNI